MGCFFNAKEGAEMADEEKIITPDGEKDKDLDVDDGTKDKNTYDKEYVDSLKTEAKNRRLQLRGVEAELKKLKDEKLSDSEKKDARIKDLEKDADDAKTSKKESDLNSMIVGIASTKGFADIDTVMLIAKKELASEEDINTKLVEKVIEKIVKEKPFLLVSSITPTPSPGNTEKTKLEGEKSPDQLMGDFLHS